MSNKTTVALSRTQYREIIRTMKRGGAEDATDNLRLSWL